MIPTGEGGMFFKGMRFMPTEDMTQQDLNRLLVHLLRRLFLDQEGNMPTIKHEDKNPMLSVVQFLMDMDIILNDEAFEDIPDDLRRFFIVKYRDGKEHRYGSKPW